MKCFCEPKMIIMIEFNILFNLSYAYFDLKSAPIINLTI